MTLVVFGAPYEAHNVEGMRYWSFARALDTGKYYSASGVVFQQNQANVRLKWGKRLELTLDQETIEDPQEVVATDPCGLSRALYLDGIDELPNGSETLISVGAAAPAKL